MTTKLKLHEKQWQVFSDSSRFIVLVAGRRWGKTVLAITDLIASAWNNPKSRSWYISPTYRQSEMIAWKMLLNMIPKEAIVKKDETRLELYLTNGSEIALKGADNEDALRGAGLNFVVLDEYAQIKPNVWQEIVRPMLTDTKGRALFIGTPKGKNSLWELYLKGQRHEDGYSSYLFKTVSNPYIDPQEVEDAKKQLNERYFRQEYEASFEDYTGLIYPEFNRDHIIEPIYLPNVYKRIGAIDPATTGTTGVLKAGIDEDGNLFIYSEYYEANKRASEVAEAIKEDIRWYIDPASSGSHIQREGRLYTLFDEYADNGIRAESAEKDVDMGINRVGEYFKTGKIKIFSTCKSLIYELERYHWSEEKETTSGMMKPKPYKKDDHLCLAKGTKILMDDLSQKNIEDVKKGDYVQTSNGIQCVIDSAMTGKNINIKRITLSNRSKLIGTGNHPIYTRNEIKTLDSLRYSDIIEIWNKSYLKSRNIFGVVGITNRLVDVFRGIGVSMLQFGKMLMELSQKVCAYTILMVIEKIIPFQILFVYRKASIPRIILLNHYKMKSIGNEITSIWKEYVHSQKYGIGRNKVENGIVNTVRLYGKTSQSEDSLVSVAVKYIRQKILHLVSFAQIIVNQLKEEKKKKILSNVFALFVRYLSELTNTLLHKPVHVLAVEDYGQHDVYNLTVNNSHNYFANNILVANCDCLRYLVSSRFSKTEMKMAISYPLGSAWGKAQAIKQRRETYVH